MQSSVPPGVIPAPSAHTGAGNSHIAWTVASLVMLAGALIALLVLGFRVIVQGSRFARIFTDFDTTHPLATRAVYAVPVWGWYAILIGAAIGLIAKEFLANTKCTFVVNCATMVLAWGLAEACSIAFTLPLIKLIDAIQRPGG
jgi:hypothetical protein